MKTDVAMYQEIEKLLQQYGASEIMQALVSSADAVVDVSDPVIGSLFIRCSDAFLAARVAIARAEGNGAGITLAMGAGIMTSIAMQSELETDT